MTTVLDCSEVVKRLWDYLDGELDAEMLAGIRIHLATCTGCSSHVEFCRSFLTRLDSVPVNAEEAREMRERVGYIRNQKSEE
jgi:hypothetical protein